jgi:RNA polymerase sigma factor (sigma-70 family)
VDSNKKGDIPSKNTSRARNASAHWVEVNAELEKLIQAAKAGGRRETEALLKATYPYLKTIAKQVMLGRRLPLTQVDDLSQKLAITFSQKFHQYDPNKGSRPLAYLKGIAWRLWWDVLRAKDEERCGARRRRTSRRPDDDELTEGKAEARFLKKHLPTGLRETADSVNESSGPFEIAEARAQLRLLEAKMTGPDLALLTQQYLEGTSIEELASSRGMSPEGMKTRLRRARDKARDIAYQVAA